MQEWTKACTGFHKPDESQATRFSRNSQKPDTDQRVAHQDCNTQVFPRIFSLEDTRQYTPCPKGTRMYMRRRSVN